MRRSLVQLFAVLAAVLLLTAEATARQVGTVTGRVTSDGSPVVGAQITVVGTNRGGVTDSRGIYLLPGIPAGTQTLRVQSMGYRATETTVTVTPGASVVHNFNVIHDAVQLERLAVTVGSRARVSAAEELAVPVDVFTRADIIEAVPQMEMAMVLQELSPAIYFPRAQIADITSGVRPFQLRGLSPDHSLVLVNGKRRHPTSVVHVFGAASGGSGSSGVDMNALIPASLGGMEILRDGAAAQYGSDAIAGVINLQLRRDVHKPQLTFSTGQYTPRSQSFRRDGTRLEVAGSSGLRLSNRGSVVLSGMFSDRQRTDRAGPDARDQIVPGDADIIEVGPDGIGRIVQKNNPVKQPNHLIGDGETTNVGAFANMNYALGANQLSEAYAFGGYTWRRDISSGFFRRSIQAQNWPTIHPVGFLPSFRGDNKDLMAVAGLRGPLAGSWSYDASAQWNRNVLDTDIFNTLNVSLGPCLEGRDAPCAPGPWPAGMSPIANKTDVYAGTLRLNQAIASFDIVREVELGFASPLSVALGTAFRADNFQITAGEPASWVNGGHRDRNGGVAAPGSQVFTGFRPDQEVDKWRTNVGVYADLESEVVSRLRLAGAARFENYSDFGATVTGKLAARVQAAEQFIIRGAVSTGFRAPNLSQSYYGHVSTGFRTDPDNPSNQIPYEIGEVPVESAVARALGAESLREEKSVNFSGGIAFSPTENLTFTVDGYRIDVDDRIILTGSIEDPPGSTIIRDLLAPYGAPTVKFFTNSVDTRTQGVDVSARYRHNLGVERYLEVLGQYNRNTVEVTGVHVPAVIETIRDRVFTSGERYAIQNSRPKDRGTARVRYLHNWFRTTLGGNYYGLQAFRLVDGGTRTTPHVICAEPGDFKVRCTDSFDAFLDNGPHVVFDADASFRVRRGLELSVGAENITNREPPVRPAAFNFSGNFPYYSTSGLHMNGRYVYTQLRVNF
jgi:iron complex outermembrane recepter protein